MQAMTLNTSIIAQLDTLTRVVTKTEQTLKEEHSQALIPARIKTQSMHASISAVPMDTSTLESNMAVNADVAIRSIITVPRGLYAIWHVLAIRTRSAVVVTMRWFCISGVRRSRDGIHYGQYILIESS